jgi:hypothetical protein
MATARLCRECGERQAYYKTIGLCVECKQDIYAGDDRWHHEHALTGEARKCEGNGCKATWPVYCHSGHRRRCERCQEGNRREQARNRQARLRASEKADRDMADEMFGIPLREVMIQAQKLRAKGMTSGQAYRDLLDSALCRQMDLIDEDDPDIAAKTELLIEMHDSEVESMSLFPADWQ